MALMSKRRLFIRPPAGGAAQSPDAMDWHARDVRPLSVFFVFAKDVEEKSTAIAWNHQDLFYCKGSSQNRLSKTQATDISNAPC